ncbi:MAG: hypothetical protein IPJ98_13380 [Bryobacterales bacterium]|nr:hypothetical protein [Bryobacterales bacterium]
MTERELDQLLDAALPAYVAEPADGLAGRVVERGAAARVALGGGAWRLRRGWRWRWWR